VVRHSAALLSLAVLCNGSDALARNPRDVFPVEGAVGPHRATVGLVHAQPRLPSEDRRFSCARAGRNYRQRQLSDELSRSKGVICPPAEVDPGISAPLTGGGVPGTPGGDPRIIPK
jgi:hypothetical protein